MSKRENILNIILVSMVMVTVLALSLTAPPRSKRNAAGASRGSKKIGQVQYKQANKLSITPMIV